MCVKLSVLKLSHCFQENCGDFEESQWYACLVFLGLHNEEDEASIEDDDVKLLPAIVDKIILPKLTSKTISSLCYLGSSVIL